MSTHETLDIIKLIESSSLKNDPKYNTELVKEYKKYFTTQEQKMFLNSFYCYIHYKPDDFVVSLRDVWKWIGFSRIDHAKTLLIKEFKENTDYINENFAPANSGAKKDDENAGNVLLPNSAEQKDNRGGHNKEDTILTIKCFKKLCLKARTKKADEIHDYYIKLEEITHEITKKQLEDKKQEIDNIKTQTQNNLIFNFENKHVVYVIHIEDQFYKFGYTKNIKDRIKCHTTEFGNNIKLTYIFETLYNREFESLIKSDEVLKKYITKKTYKSNQTELFELNDEFTVTNLNERLEYLKKNVNGELINFLTNENTELKKNIEKINKENRILHEKVSRMTKIGYVEKIIGVHYTCSRCGHTKNKEDYNINSVTNEPKSLCIDCEKHNAEKFDRENAERLLAEEEITNKKREELRQLREQMLNSDEIRNCSRCKKDTPVRDMGVDARTNQYYKICNVCRKQNTTTELIGENETECGKCHKTFETEYNEVKRLNYKTCRPCREKDKKRTERNITDDTTNKECYVCHKEFISEPNKKKTGFYKSCADCRVKHISLKQKI